MIEVLVPGVYAEALWPAVSPSTLPPNLILMSRGLPLLKQSQGLALGLAMELLQERNSNRPGDLSVMERRQHPQQCIRRRGCPDDWIHSCDREGLGVISACLMCAGCGLLLA